MRAGIVTDVVRGATLVAAFAAASLVSSPTAAVAAEQAPTVWPWQRTYVPVPSALGGWAEVGEMFQACALTDAGAVLANQATGRPTIAVLGDSVQNQVVGPLLSDPEYHWVVATHCGENLGTAVTSGRLATALGYRPDVVVGGVGSNSFTRFDGLHEELFPAFEADLDRFLDLTRGVRCRVLFNVPERAPAWVAPDVQAAWIRAATRANAVFARIDPVRHPNTFVIDWAAMVRAFPGLLWDDQHLTRAGQNARINAMVAAARRCHPPDAPVAVDAVAGPGSATVTWAPRPPEEGVALYEVTASNGDVRTTRDTSVSFSPLAPGAPVRFTVRAANLGGGSGPSPPSPTVTPHVGGARFHALTPTRVLDTRDGTGGRLGPLRAGESLALAPATTAPALAGASALVLQVTATQATAPTFLTVWPGDGWRPPTSNLNPGPGPGARPTLVTSPTGSDGTVQLYNNSGEVHVVADVVGWYDRPGTGTGALFAPVPPARVLDTRDGTGGPRRPFGTGETRVLHLAGVPADATAAVLNLTSTAVTGRGFVTTWAAGTPRPLASALNPEPGRTDANLTMVALGGDRDVALYNHAASTELVADLVGYFTADGARTGGSEYHPVRPARLVDSRDGTGGVTGPLAGGATTSLRLTGSAGVPAEDVVAVDATVTVVGPDGPGHVTMWPGGAEPATSTLNFGAGEVVANRALVGLGPDGTTRTTSGATRHQLVDVSGWFGPPLTGP